MFHTNLTAYKLKQLFFDTLIIQRGHFIRNRFFFTKNIRYQNSYVPPKKFLFRKGGALIRKILSIQRP